MTDAKYNSQDEKAHSTILLSLSDKVLYEVVDEETVVDVWKKLEKLYMTKLLTNKLFETTFVFTSMKEGSTLNDHLDALNSILMDLKNVEVKIDDEDAALILLVSLPPSFENFVKLLVLLKKTLVIGRGNDSLAKLFVKKESFRPGGKKGIFIGYGDGVNGYRIWSPCERRVILSRNVTFDEDYLFHVKQDPVESKLQ
ncbi:hypothetical protein Tco_1391622 [Tanacetum coccineum]